jgi:hypothetical protein
MDYADCDGYKLTQSYTLELDRNWYEFGGDFSCTECAFAAENILKIGYGAYYSNQVVNNSERISIQNSTAPQNIAAKTLIVYGESTTLELSGGELADNSVWMWYEQGCGANYSIGVGERITVKPISNTRYFVRAEGINDTTNCAYIDISVDAKSKPPSAIKISNPNVCSGSIVNLSVEGGVLGKNAEWIWTQDDCNGKQIGKGSNISVTVSANTTFFVKAVGDDNTTECLQQSVKVTFPIEAPSNLISDQEVVCEGEKVIFSLNHSNSNIDGVWKWMTGDCSVLGKPLGEGLTYELKATKTIKISVYGENLCGKSKCVTKELTVKELSKEPNVISVSSSDIYRKRKYSYTALGGYLGEGAKYVWYKNSLINKPFAEGKTIEVKTKKETKYIIRVEGECNQTKEVSKTIIPLRVHKFEKRFDTDRPKFLSLGFGMGGFTSTSESVVVGQSIYLDGDSLDRLTIDKKGGNVFISFFPVFTKIFSLGIIPEISYASVNAYEDSEAKGNIEFKKTFYEYSYKVKTEAAFGFNQFKAFGSFTWGHQQIGGLSINKSFSESASGIRSYLQQPDILQFSDMQLGIRLGKYERNKFIENAKSKDPLKAKKPIVFYDLYIVQRRFSVYDNNTDLNFKIQEPLNSVFGYGLSIWNQNKFRLNFELLVLPESKDQFITHRDRVLVNLGFSFCLGRYY